MPTIRSQASSNAGNVTLGSVTAGSTIVGSFTQASAASPTISSVTGGGTWAQVPGVYFADTTDSFTGDMWILQNASGGSTTVSKTWSAGSQDHDYIIELSPSVLDTAATGARRVSTNTSITVPNAVASSILVLDAVSTTNWGAFAATYTQGTGGPLNSNPFGYVNNPGDTAGRAATFTDTDSGLNIGASFKDATTPTLSSPIGTTIGSYTADVGATTDTASGTLYSVITTSATQPTAAQIKAGQDHTGTAAPWSGNQAISSTGAKTFNATGLSAATTYYAHFVHNSAGGDSNRVSSSSFTTIADWNTSGIGPRSVPVSGGGPTGAGSSGQFAWDVASGTIGTFASTLGDVTAAFSGAITNNGSFASILGDVTAAFSGNVGGATTGTFASTLGDVTAAFTGNVTNPGTFASTLGNITASFAGTVTDSGTFASTLGNVTAALSGTVSVPGVFASTLGDVTAALSGQVIENATGTINATLGDVVASFSGTVDVPTTADRLRTMIGVGV